MNNKKYTATIIVPFYNQENIVENNIRSLLRQNYPSKNLSFVFIDDGSTDKTTQILNEFAKEPRITAIFFPNNQGRSISRNAGITATDSELIGFLDGDMIVEPDWLQLLINSLDDNVVGVVGDSCLPKDRTPNLLDRYLYSFYRGARKIGENKPLYFRWFLFNNAIIRRSSLEMIGNFDITFTTYGGEDTDLAIRLWEANPKALRFSSKAISQHHHIRELDEFCKSMYQYGKTNLSRLLIKYPQHKNDLGGQYINSIRGYIIFNHINRFAVYILGLIMENFWFTRYLVLDSVIRGARNARKKVSK